MSKLIDITGQTFGRWRALRVLKDVPFSKWECRCSCGTIRMVDGASLRAGKTRSCGCVRKEQIAAHNAKVPSIIRMARTSPLYGIWMGMKNRCESPGSLTYANYGARGIRVCARWQVFENFVKDMAPRPSPRHSIDRIDKNGPYSFENCRWATPRQQARNKRTNRWITANGKRKLLVEWAEEIGVSISTLHARLKKKTLDEILDSNRK